MKNKLLLTAMVALALASGFDQKHLEMKLCTVPFELIDNRIFVNVQLNGQGPFHILFDTGAGASLSRETAEKLQLPNEGETEASGVGTSTVHGFRSHLKSIAIGAATVENVKIDVLPFNDSSAVFGKVPVDGYLGFPFYEKYVVEHDYIKQTLVFRDPGTFEYAGRGTLLAIESTDYVPVVSGSVDGISAKFGIDTGARSAILLYGPFVSEHGLREKYKPKFHGVTGWGIGGPVQSEIARVTSVAIGDVQIHDVVARFSLNRQGVTSGSSKAGLVGPDILKRFTLTCDYAGKTIILEKNKNFGIHDTYDKAGLWMIQNADSFEVLDVIEGGPAANAGLRTADRIIAVDGKSVSDMSLPEVRDRWKYAAAGTKILLRVQVPSGTKEFLLILQELV